MAFGQLWPKQRSLRRVVAGRAADFLVVEQGGARLWISELASHRDQLFGILDFKLAGQRDRGPRKRIRIRQRFVLRHDNKLTPHRLPMTGKCTEQRIRPWFFGDSEFRATAFLRKNNGRVSDHFLHVGHVRLGKGVGIVEHLEHLEGQLPDLS